MMRFDIVNLGCKVNRVESDDIAARLLAAGAVRDERNPQVVVVNTCTVTGEAEKKTRKAVRGVLRAHEQASVLVTGCAAAIDPDEFTSMSPRVRVVGKTQVVSACLGEPDEDIVQVPVARVGEGFPTRVGLKVQDGCRHACTYCIVHTARGPERSVALPAVVDAARTQVAAGARELVLTGINLGAYRDSENGADLAVLVRALRSACPQARVRISSVEPLDVSDELIDVLAEEDGMVCRHLHLPLQAGCSRVLREMARPYTAERFRDIVERLYDRVPALSLSTDIICGFPGETDQDFAETLELARACRFSKIHVFRYSRRQGTPAAKRPDQVPPEVIAARAHELSRLGDELRTACALERVGRTERVLVEEDGRGTTESYYPVQTGALPRGVLQTVTLTSFDKDGIFTL